MRKRPPPSRIRSRPETPWPSTAEERRGEAHHPRDREQQEHADAQGQDQPEPAGELAPGLGQAADQDRDEDDVVDAEDDLHGGQRGQRQEAVGGEERAHRDRPAGAYFTCGQHVPREELDRGEVLHVEHLEQHALHARRFPLLEARHDVGGGAHQEARLAPGRPRRRASGGRSRGPPRCAGPRRPGRARWRAGSSGSARSSPDRGGPPRSAWPGLLACGGRYRGLPG